MDHLALSGLPSSSSEPRPAQRRRVQLLASGPGPATGATFGDEVPPLARTQCPSVPAIPASRATTQVATAAAPSGLLPSRTDVRTLAPLSKPYGVTGAEGVGDVHRLAAPACASAGGGDNGSGCGGGTVDVMHEVEVAFKEAQPEAMAPAAAEAAPSGGEDEGELPPCDCCPLCMHILYDPVTTPCNHTFCGRCFRRWADVYNRRRSGLWHPVTPGPAGDGSSSGSSAGGNERPVGQVLLREQSRGPSEATVTCPLCRSQVPAYIACNLVRAAEMQLLHPVAYATRGSEIAEEQAQMAAFRAVSKKLYIGNLHSMVQVDQGPLGNEGINRNRHCWTFFIRMDNELQDREFIERVVVHLHRTFNPPVVVLTEPPFLVRRVGWGIFVVRAEVHFKERWRHPPIWCRWLLDFDGMGDMMEAELEFTEQQPPGPAATATQPSPGDGSSGGHAAAFTSEAGAVPEGGSSPLGGGGGPNDGRPPPGPTAAVWGAPVTPAATTRRSGSASGLLPALNAANAVTAANGVGGSGRQGGGGDEGGHHGGGGGFTAAGSVSGGNLRSLWMAPTLRDMLESSSARSSTGGGASVNLGETGRSRGSVAVLAAGSGNGNGSRWNSVGTGALPFPWRGNDGGAAAGAAAVGGRSGGGGGGGVVEIDMTLISDSSDGNEDETDNDTLSEEEGGTIEAEEGERMQGENRDVFLRMFSHGSDDESTSQSSGDQVRSEDDDGGGDGLDWDSWA